MKNLSRRLALALGLAAVLWPVASFSQEVPVEEEVKGGGATSYLSYAGQTFKLTSSVPVKIKFESISLTRIHVEFKASTPGGIPGRMSLYWVNFAVMVYQGEIPVDEPWVGDLNTEGGFVDR
jgi:hypothetical protein